MQVSVLVRGLGRCDRLYRELLLLLVRPALILKEYLGPAVGNLSV